MRRLLNLTTLTFGLFAGLFTLNRFYDLINYSDSISLTLILAYCLHILIILGIGLILFNKQKKIGFWLILIFESFVIIRHSIEFKSYLLPDQRLKIPDEILNDLIIPYYELIFVAEILLGLTSIILLIKTKKRKTVANST